MPARFIMTPVVIAKSVKLIETRGVNKMDKSIRVIFELSEIEALENILNKLILFGSVELKKNDKTMRKVYAKIQDTRALAEKILSNSFLDMAENILNNSKPITPGGRRHD